MAKVHRYHIAVTVFASCGEPAWASIGEQPDVLATCSHLAVLTPALGAVSGILLARFFRRGKTLGEAVRGIVASYVAAAMALALALLGLRPLLAWPGFECATLAAWPLTIAAGVCCVLLHSAVFALFAIPWSRNHVLSRRLLAGVVAGGLVGVLVTGWYACILPRSFFTNLDVVRRIDVPPPDGFVRLWVYYVTPDGDHIASVALDGAASGNVADLPVTQGARPAILSIDDNARGASIRVEYANGEGVQVDLDRFGEVAAFDSSKTVGGLEYGVASVGSDSKWTAMPLFTSSSILAVSSGSSKEQFGFDTPITFPVGAWYWSGNRYTVLPGGFVVFCIGRRDICIVDLEERRVAFLAEGYSPLVFAELPSGE